MTAETAHEGSATRVTTTHWILEARGAWRWLAGILGLSSLGSAVVLIDILREQADLWILLALPVTLAFGLLMTAVGIRGSVRVPIRRTVTSSGPREPGP